MRDHLVFWSGLLLAGALVVVWLRRSKRSAHAPPGNPGKKSLGSLQAARELVITDADLEIIPDRLDKKCPMLLKIDLHGNKLHTFPESICSLSKLQVLNLSSNQITRLPEEIGQLQQLEDLNLAHNQLRRLPHTIGQMRNLKLFNVMGNQLESLPESIGDLKQLYRLGLKSNKLKTLPSTFGGLEGEHKLVIVWQISNAACFWAAQWPGSQNVSASVSLSPCSSGGAVRYRQCTGASAC